MIEQYKRADKVKERNWPQRDQNVSSFMFICGQRKVSDFDHNLFVGESSLAIIVSL
jgi:hypothetical protein